MTHDGTLLEVRENLELGIAALCMRKNLASEGEWDELNDLHVEHQREILAKLDALITDVPDEPIKPDDAGYEYVNDLHIYLCDCAKLLHQATQDINKVGV